MLNFRLVAVVSHKLNVWIVDWRKIISLKRFQVEISRQDKAKNTKPSAILFQHLVDTYNPSVRTLLGEYRIKV